MATSSHQDTKTSNMPNLGTTQASPRIIIFKISGGFPNLAVGILKTITPEFQERLCGVDGIKVETSEAAAWENAESWVNEATLNDNELWKFDHAAYDDLIEPDCQIEMEGDETSPKCGVDLKMYAKHMKESQFTLFEEIWKECGLLRDVRKFKHVRRPGSSPEEIRQLAERREEWMRYRRAKSAERARRKMLAKELEVQADDGGETSKNLDDEGNTRGPTGTACGARGSVSGRRMKKRQLVEGSDSKDKADAEK